MRSAKWNLLALLVLLSALATPLLAQDLHEEEFSGPDLDGAGPFEPETRNPSGEADYDGLPPVDWSDNRNGWIGTLEENLSTVGDDPSYPAPDPGADTPEYGVLQPEDGSGPFWSPTSFDSNCPTICYNIDNYADPAVPVGGGGGGGVPDWWWTNASGDAGFAYLFESGITGHVDIGGATWTYRTTSGVPIATVPVGSWYELEVCHTQGLDGTLDSIATVYDATGTIPLGSVTLLAGPVNQPLSVQYSWFTNFTANVDVLFVDDFRVECVPEPSSIALLGMGAIGLVAVVRRRRNNA